MKHALAQRCMARIGTAGAIASAVLFVAPLHAQDSRLSLADRVSRLEQQVQNRDQGGTSLVNRLQQMQAQMQQMQGQIEELQHQLQELQDKSKAQYVDVDSRLGRLEHVGASPAQGNPPAGAASAPGNGQPAAAGSAPAPAGAESSGKHVPTPADASMQAAYGTAFKALRSGDYVSASRGFRDYIQKYPDTSLTPNAFYWLGESYYVTQNYPVALEAFQHLLKQFPDSEKAPDALLKLGYTQLELKQSEAARSTLESVVARYPGSKVAGLAQERLRRLDPAR
jgi:tol-pal system protein YbgF